MNQDSRGNFPRPLSDPAFQLPVQPQPSSKGLSGSCLSVKLTGLVDMFRV